MRFAHSMTRSSIFATKRLKRWLPMIRMSPGMGVASKLTSAGSIVMSREVTAAMHAAGHPRTVAVPAPVSGVHVVSYDGGPVG